MVLKSAIIFDTFGCARHNPSKLGFCSHLHESSRHGKAQTSLALLIWLNEIVLQRAAPPQEHWDAYSIAGTPAARPARPAA